MEKRTSQSALWAVVLLFLSLFVGSANAETDELRSVRLAYELVATYRYPITYVLWVMGDREAEAIAHSYNRNALEENIAPVLPRKAPYIAGWVILTKSHTFYFVPMIGDVSAKERLRSSALLHRKRTSFLVDWESFGWRPIPWESGNRGHPLFPIALMYLLAGELFMPTVSGESTWDVQRRLGWDRLPDPDPFAPPPWLTFK